MEASFWGGIDPKEERAPLLCYWRRESGHQRMRVSAFVWGTVEVGIKAQPLLCLFFYGA